ncbi:MAG TPA: ribokinase [Pilimelia sp.]|nr:ribokinase [Pilimelia sp.]
MAGRAVGGLLVLGSLNMDVTVRVDGLPRTGETVLGEDAAFRPGGKGANQAVAAAVAGADVRFAGCVGADPDGQALRAALVRAGVDVTLLRSTDRRRTGLAVVLVDRSGHNAIAVSPGANHAVVVEEVNRLDAELRRADVLLMQMELPVDVVVRAVELAEAVGTPVILNLAPPTRVPPAVLARLAVLVVNEPEAEFLLGEALSDLATVRAAASRLRALGPAAVVVTAGARGAVVDDGSGVVHVPAVPVEVVDTTGAGDAFVGALAADISRGTAVRDAVYRAVAVAADAVQTAGAQLTRAERGVPVRP